MQITEAKINGIYFLPLIIREGKSLSIKAQSSSKKIINAAKIKTTPF